MMIMKMKRWQTGQDRVCADGMRMMSSPGPGPDPAGHLSLL